LYFGDLAGGGILAAQWGDRMTSHPGPSHGSILARLWKLIWPDNVANIAAIIIALMAGLLGLFDVLDVKKLIALTLTILAILGYSLIRDRVSRDALTLSLKELLEANRLLPAERFFSRQTSELTILSGAHQSAYLIQETGHLVTERYQDELVKTLQAGGIVKFVVCLPSSKPTTTLAYRNENLEDPAAIVDRLNGFHNQLKSIKRAAGSAFRKLEVRYTPYDVGFTLVLANSVSQIADKSGLVRLAGFRVPYSKKLDFVFDSRQSPSIVDHFNKEFEDIFASSTKAVLLTAEPRFGKTKMFESLLSYAANRDDVYFVISLRERGESGGNSFAAHSSVNSKVKRTFARKLLPSDFPERDIRQYEIEPSVWEHFAQEIRDASKAKKLIIIDEIGEMQLQNKLFCDVVREIMADPDITLFATVAMDESRHPMLKELYEHHRSTVYQVTTDNQSIIMEQLNTEFKAALRLQEYLSTNG
jgi:nucleoside-triphosphatase THEP1